MKNIAIVDDEKDIVEIASFYIELEGFKVFRFYNANTFVASLGHGKYDCIVLDLMLPEVDGISILKYLKSNEKTKDIPVLILTAKGTERDIITGIEAGASDYITKPFSPKVLAAKVKAFLGKSRQEPVVKVGDLTIDELKFEVYYGGDRIELTSTEFRILKLLVDNIDKVFTRDQLLNEIWSNTTSPTDRAVDVHIKNLRDKLKEFGKHIKTIRGVGYKFSTEE
jgi:DNA-binding response OmpR family regulator